MHDTQEVDITLTGRCQSFIFHKVMSEPRFQFVTLSYNGKLEKKDNKIFLAHDACQYFGSSASLSFANYQLDCSLSISMR